MKKRIEFNPSEKGLRAVLKGYQEIALRILWESKEALNSRAIWMKANEVLKPESISRASIINFLEAMREAGVLKVVERTGKGGHHYVYSPNMTKAEFKEFVASTIISNLMRDFPEETTAAISKIAN
jgi:Fe2+ or Zn2+ uptake regulation protein